MESLLIVVSIFCGEFMVGPCFVVHYLVSSLQSSPWERNIAGCFILIVCQCSVSQAHGAVGWHTVCNCGVPLSYSLSLTFSVFFFSSILNLRCKHYPHGSIDS